MNGETDVDTGLMTKEEEQITEKENSQEKNSPSRKQSAVMVTNEEVVRVATPDKEIWKEGSGLSEFGCSPLGSFQLIPSSQSSEGDKIISYVPPLGDIMIWGYLVGGKL